MEVIKEFLGQPSGRTVSTGEHHLVIWDENVLEKLESLRIDGSSVHNHARKSLKRISQGISIYLGTTDFLCPGFTG